MSWKCGLVPVEAAGLQMDRLEPLGQHQSNLLNLSTSHFIKIHCTEAVKKNSAAAKKCDEQNKENFRRVVVKGKSVKILIIVISSCLQILTSVY